MRISVGDFKIGEEEKSAVMDVLKKGRISEWVVVNDFEKDFADFVGVKHAVAVNSGTSALIAGLTSLTYDESYNVKEGTNVITTPLTYIATSNSIVKSNLKPVYVDVDKETFVITPENIRQHLETVDDVSSYSVLLPVHLMGYACDMDEINNIAKTYGLKSLEDSSQAHGTVYKNRRTGSLSLLSTFSFYVAHNIQAGEMGAVATNDAEIARLVRKIKAHGRMCDCPVCTRPTGYCAKSAFSPELDLDPRFTHELIGYNFKTTEIQAALALSQLKKAPWIIKRRRENVKYLNESLDVFSDVLQLPKYSEDVSYLAYCITIKKPETISRAKLRIELERNGIETRPLFGCIPTQQPAFDYLRNKYLNKLPVAEYLGKNAFYIGCHQYLNPDELDYIVQKFKLILNNVL